jgi:hypothetical protein
MSLKDKLRSITVGAKKDFKGEIIDFMGEKFEVREPSEAQYTAIYQRAYETKLDGDNKGKISVNLAEQAVWGLICCTYVPGTDEHVFDENDYDSLMNMPQSQLEPLKDAVRKYLNYSREDVRKNLSETSDATTSSNSDEN